MATQSKTQLLNNVHTLLKRRYKPKADRNLARLSVLKAVVYGICHENTTREQANQALSRFEDEFFDWNEVRVSSVDEIKETLAGIPDPEGRAQRIRRFLRQLFNRTYSFTLDALAKKPLKEAIKVLEKYEALASDYVTATVIQQALGAHAIPIDESAHRVLRRLGFTETSVPALRSILERAIPKNRGVEFLELIEELASETCVEAKPDCPHCELRKICTFALTRKNEPPVRSTPARASKDGAKAAPSKAPAVRPARAADKSAPKKASKEPPHAAKSPPGKQRGNK